MREREDVVEEVSSADGQVSDASKEIRRNTYSSSHRSLFSHSRRAGGGIIAVVICISRWAVQRLSCLDTKLILTLLTGIVGSLTVSSIAVIIRRGK